MQTGINAGIHMALVHEGARVCKRMLDVLKYTTHDTSIDYSSLQSRRLDVILPAIDRGDWVRVGVRQSWTDKEGYRWEAIDEYTWEHGELIAQADQIVRGV